MDLMNCIKSLVQADTNFQVWKGLRKVKEYSIRFLVCVAGLDPGDTERQRNPLKP